MIILTEFYTQGSLAFNLDVCSDIDFHTATLEMNSDSELTAYCFKHVILC